jgi:hypothetical protein
VKKILGILIIAAFLVFPVCAAADNYVFTADMDVDAYSIPPNYGGYLTGYRVVNITPWIEIFCVENSGMNGSLVPYDFYTIDTNLSGNIIDVNKEIIEAGLIAATWYAHQYTLTPTQATKYNVQVAIWETMFSIYGPFGDDPPPPGAKALMDTFDGLSAADQDDYVDEWLLAARDPIIEDGVNKHKIDWNSGGQNYLVPNLRRVPEPANMLLLGTGLICLAGIGRQKFLKRK